jgi:hypothetical protein
VESVKYSDGEMDVAGDVLEFFECADDVHAAVRRSGVLREFDGRDDSGRQLVAGQFE